MVMSDYFWNSVLCIFRNFLSLLKLFWMNYGFTQFLVLFRLILNILIICFSDFSLLIGLPTLSISFFFSLVALLISFFFSLSAYFICFCSVCRRCSNSKINSFISSFTLYFFSNYYQTNLFLSLILLQTPMLQLLRVNSMHWTQLNETTLYSTWPASLYHWFIILSLLILTCRRSMNTACIIQGNFLTRGHLHPALSFSVPLRRQQILCL